MLVFRVLVGADYRCGFSVGIGHVTGDAGTGQVAVMTAAKSTLKVAKKLPLVALKPWCRKNLGLPVMLWQSFQSG